LGKTTILCQSTSCTLLSFNDPQTTEIYTLSLHDALPISQDLSRREREHEHRGVRHARVPRSDQPHRAGALRNPLARGAQRRGDSDRKSTRLNSSHQIISYAVFCLKKKNKRVNRPKK